MSFECEGSKRLFWRLFQQLMGTLDANIQHIELYCLIAKGATAGWGMEFLFTLAISMYCFSQNKYNRIVALALFLGLCNEVLQHLHL